MKSILIVPDAHIPHHDKRAWALMMKVGRALKPDLVVTIGDLADFYAVSFHSKDPQLSTRLKNEVSAVNAALDELDSLGASDKIFIEGNHCDRLVRYLRDRAPALFEMTGISALFNLKGRGWEYVPYRKHARRGKLYFTHDVGQSGKYANYAALAAFELSVVTGHSHRLAYAVEGDITGRRKAAACFGWLGDITKIDYMSRAKATKEWALGFGIGYINPKTGTPYLVPVPIFNYSCVVNGTLYTA